MEESNRDIATALGTEWSSLGEWFSEHENWMVEIRRHLHRFPELSHHEKQTTRFVKEQLEQWNIPAVSLTGKDVIGTLQGGKPGKTVALRADMDALPVLEETGLPFVSTVPGVMHACGHDGHTAILLTIAKVFAEHKEHIPGTIKFVFQHAEEVVPGGAMELVQAGVMDEVDGVFGLHLWQPVDKGLVAAKSGPLMAGTDEFTITIHGRGGHGSMPHDTIDPVVIAAHLITQLQTVVSRRINPLSPAVVSIGKVQAGEAFNVIPDKATLSGTVRYFDRAVGEQAQHWIRKITEGLCEGFSATCSIDYTPGDPPVINDEWMNRIVVQSAIAAVGEERVTVASPSMGGEDFSYYLQRKRGAYFFVGMGGDVSQYPHHHPRFDIDESVMPYAAHILAGSALRFLLLAE